KVVLTPSDDKMPGAIKKAEALHAEIPNSFIPQQFENIANPDIHRTTTAKEILEQMDHNLDAFVSTAGTGSTITSTGDNLKVVLPVFHIPGVEPRGAAVLTGNKPAKQKIVWISPGFIPNILNTDIHDDIYQIEDDDAVEMFKLLPKTEGIFLGVSGAAAV